MKENYKFGQKNNWRRWIWNRIVERLDKPTRQAAAVYMAGPQDLDREVAIRHGFKSHNLISAERENKFIGRIRESGALCVAGDFFDAAFSLSSRLNIDVVFGDFVCGLNRRELELGIKATIMPSFKNAVFAFNFLRGRDGESTDFRNNTDQVLAECGLDEYKKHRGLQLYYGLVGDIARESQVSSDEWRRFYESNIVPQKPDIMSYKSGNQVFDSIVFKNPFSTADWSGVEETFAKSMLAKIPLKTHRSTTAILAHRTMKINGCI